jgi:aryl-alcohol dehydrogenase-like predicted oxidoreductase
VEHTRLGQSDIQISVITFGAWAIGGWMWGGQDEADAVAAIHKALEAGITTFDTAAVYGFGRSEEIIAKALKGTKRQEVRILTKYGLRWDRPEGTLRFDTVDNEGRPIKVMRNSRPDSVAEECERSLKRLETDYIDLYQCHWPDPTTPVEETFGAISELIEQGKILAAGVSNYTVEQMAAAHRTLPLAASQPPYSMVNRGIEADVLPYCQENNIGVIVYSPLQRGLLTGKITEDYTFGVGDHRAENAFFEPANVRKVNALLEKIRPIAEAHDATLAQLAISWTTHRPGIAAALVGARNASQAEENAQAIDIKLCEHETQRINALLEEMKLDV